MSSSSERNGGFDPAPLLIMPRTPKELAPPAQVEVREEFDPEEVDPFVPVVNHYLKSESPSVRKAIQETPCFSRMWRDQQLQICPESECHLRALCEVGYTQATGFSVDSEEVNEDDLVLRKFKDKKVEPRRPKRKVTKQPRTIYVSRNRKSDQFLENIHRELGSPPELPFNWYYGFMGNYQARCVAQEYFIHRYGSELCGCSRKSHWRLFHNGLHVCRAWMEAKLSCWVDCNPWLADALRAKKFRMEPAIVKKGNRGTFPVYTERVRLWTEPHAVQLAQAIFATLPEMEARED